MPEDEKKPAGSKESAAEKAFGATPLFSTPSKTLGDILKIATEVGSGWPLIGGATIIPGAGNLVFSGAGVLDESSIKKQRQLEEEITKLRRQLQDQAQALNQKESTAEEYKKRVEEVENTISELNQKLRFDFLLKGINESGQRSLLQSGELLPYFLGDEEVQALVMSVDIRRSTELMLKARSPEAFARFIIT